MWRSRSRVLRMGSSLSVVGASERVEGPGNPSSEKRFCTWADSPDFGAAAGIFPRSRPTITASIALAKIRPRPPISPLASADWMASTTSWRPGPGRSRRAAKSMAMREAASASGTPAICPMRRISRQISTMTSATVSSSLALARCASKTRCCHIGSRIPAG